MKISVIGCGYLGAVHAACMAKLGHDVVGIDLDPSRISKLAAGTAPFFEPGFDQLLRESLASGRLRFALAPASEELADIDLHFIAVGTPQSQDGKAADLSYVNSAVDMILEALPTGQRTVIVGKSTVPVGTAQALAQRIEAAGATLIWNPEFLRESTAVQDTLEPDRLVYGLPADPDRARDAKAALDEVYRPLLDAGTPLVTTSYPTAELVKVSANSFLATKISFINAMAELCEATGGDVTELAEALGYDDRIGKKFLRAGVGFGGGCLPKDIRAFVARAQELGVDDAVKFLTEVDDINQRRRDRVVSLALQALSGKVEGASIAVLGASFKPNSDDIRDSPALDIAARLADLGAKVSIFDPQALPKVAEVAPELHRAESIEAATEGAELTLLLTAWPQFCQLKPEDLATRVQQAKIIDGVNSLSPHRWESAGWSYAGMGR